MVKPKIDQKTKVFMTFFKNHYGVKFVDVDSGEEVDLGEDDAE